MDDYNLSPSDEGLLEKAKRGDKAAFEIFYNRNKGHILNYVYRMTGDRMAAEEITQETFVKTYVNLDRYTAQGKPLNWVYTIAGNLCRNFLRDKRYEPRLSLDDELPGKEGRNLLDVIAAKEGGPSDLAMSKEQEDLIEACIKSLPLKFKEVLILCDIQGYSYEEAAEILGCRIGSVGSRLSRARFFLAKSLKKYLK